MTKYADRPVVIIGKGGLAREVRAMLAAAGVGVHKHVTAHPDEVDCFVDQDRPVVIGVGAPAARLALLNALRAYQLPAFSLGRFTGEPQMGRGCLVMPGVEGTVNIELGAGCLVNMSVTIGHEVRIGRGSTIAPGVNLSGNVTIGDGVLIGTGAQVLQGITIGDGARVGAGCTVVRDVDADTTVAAPPARKSIRA